MGNVYTHKASKYFLLHEIAPSSIIKSRGIQTLELFDKDYLNAIDGFREFFDTNVYMNNYYWGGNKSNRGLRHPNSTVGSTLSQHKFGRAMDCNIKGLTADQIRQQILDNQEYFLNLGWTTIEDGRFAPTWNHIDMRVNVPNIGTWDNNFRIVTA